MVEVKRRSSESPTVASEVDQPAVQLELLEPVQVRQSPLKEVRQSMLAKQSDWAQHVVRPLVVHEEWELLWEVDVE